MDTEAELKKQRELLSQLERAHYDAQSISWKESLAVSIDQVKLKIELLENGESPTAMEVAFRKACQLEQPTPD